jgi:nucleoside-diphosphate-sugar epimerase
MKVLITGAGGFIGSHLVDSQLDKGNVVRAVDLDVQTLQRVAAHPQLEIIKGDLTDPALVVSLAAGMDVVYHLASAHLDVRLSAERYRQVNVGATLALLEACSQSGAKRFVHCSSVGVIGDVDHPPADETTACRPVNIYGQTKLEGEQAALEFSRRTGFPVVVARPAWVYGPRCPRTAKLMRMLSKGRFVYFGSGDNLRHPVYIRDAVDGLELCAGVEQATGEIFIIAGETPVKVRDLVVVMSEQLGLKPPNLHLPLFLGLWAGYFFELAFKLIGKQPMFSRRSLEFFLEHNAYDIRKARRLLGFQPGTDLKTGMQKTIRWNRDLRSGKING